MSTQRSIKDGPSKLDLMLSLFEGKRVTFKIDGLGMRKAVVQTVALENGGHESWCISGLIYLDQTKPDAYTNFSGYYRTGHPRGGNMSIKNDSVSCSACGKEMTVFGHCPTCEERKRVEQTAAAFRLPSLDILRSRMRRT